MSEKFDSSREIHFEPSTIESIDRAVYDYIEDLNLFTDTNEGSKKVPVLWGTSERSFLTKSKKEVRDQQGTLKFPLISVRRTSMSKPLASGGAFQGNVPENSDKQGGSLVISRTIHHKKTSEFANADAKRTYGQDNHPRENKKVVYRTVSAPMPVNVEMMYEVTIRTEYQQQMNELMLPFLTLPGTINYVRLKSGQHKYEGFIQSDFQSKDNLSDYTSSERKFETTITIKVIGYLVGQKNNREKSQFSVRENFVEIKLPKEKVITDPEELLKYDL